MMATSRQCNLPAFESIFSTDLDSSETMEKLIKNDVYMGALSPLHDTAVNGFYDSNSSPDDQSDSSQEEMSDSSILERMVPFSNEDSTVIDTLVMNELLDHSETFSTPYSDNIHYASSPSGSESPSPPLSHTKINNSLTSVPSTAPSLVPKPSNSMMINCLPSSVPSKGGLNPPMANIILIDHHPYQLIPHSQGDVSQREVQHLQLRVVPNPQQQQHHIQKQLPVLAPLPLHQPPPTTLKSPTPILSSTLKVTHNNTLDRTNSFESNADTPDDTEEEGGGVGAGGSELDYQSDSAPIKDLDSQDNTPASSQDSNYLGQDSDCPIPNLLNETGSYGFRVLLDAKEDTLKTPTWLVSSITKKLYTNMNKPIPFRVVLKKNYPKKKFFLRAMAVFKYPMFLRQNVLRCPNHLNPVDSTNIDFAYTNHVIRADHPRAIYDSSPSGRLSVAVPLDFPESRSEAIPILLKFMCHNSCVGGINRRPMAILLTLEQNDEEVGRYTIDVRVCACPSRDVKTEEKQLIAKGLTTKSGHIYGNRGHRKRPRNDEQNSAEEDDEIYHLPVRGTVLYNYLKDLKHLYLKHHPEYARKYPDLPTSDVPMSRAMEDFGHPDALLEPGEEIRPPESPHESSMLEDKPQPVILLYSNNGDKLPPKVLMDGELPPDVRKSIVESIHSNYTNDGRMWVESGSQPAMFIKREKMNEGYSDEDIDEGGAPFIHSYTPKKKNRTPNGKHRSEGSSPRSHLQVQAMPEKHRGGLIAKSKEVAPFRARAGSEENEKVMLAAQVLASHLGSHQLDK